MKVKVNFLVIALYIMTLFISYGLFNTVNFNTEINTVDLVDTCSSDRVYQTKASVAPTTTTYNTYLEAYFSNLTENFGENYKGSCGYVAMGMILSYFDNCYSDNIIPEQYDANSQGSGRNMITRNSSPGVMNDNYLYATYGKQTKDVTAQEYYDYLLGIEHNSFHAKLILFANYIQGLYKFDDNKNSCGITMGEVLQVVSYYLYSERGFEKFRDFGVEAIEDDDEEKVKQFIKEKIDKGLPVYTCLKNGSEGHATVAYAYDSAGTIYLHSGWHGWGTRQTVSSLSFKKIYRAAAIEFYLPEHIHSDNYEVTKGGETNNYCYCSDDILTYKHDTHNYVYDHLKIDGNNHYAYCTCGDRIIEGHNYNARYEKTSSDTTHIAYCKCGESATKNHVWTAYSPFSVGAVTFVQCRHCKFTKKLKNDELIPILPYNRLIL